jgi:L-aspartate oxidase
LFVPIAPQGRYLRDFDTRDLPHRTTNVLVIGGGIAGLQSSLAAGDEGAEVLLVAKGDSSETNTSRAQGGVAASMDADDTPSLHATDTLETGCGLANPEAVRVVTDGAASAIHSLIELGANFDRDAEGALALGREGGHGRRRIVHAEGDLTGREIMRALSGAVASHPCVRRESAFLVDLLTEDGACVGALFEGSDRRMFVVRAHATVMATGGAGRMYRESSNAHGATGDGVAAAFRAGVSVRDLEFVQFHPTALYLAGSPRVLVTEAVRGEGAHIIDDHGVRFVAEQHPNGELAPRDVVSRAIVRHLARDDVGGVFLDFRHLPSDLVPTRFPGLQRTCARHELDPARDPIPVRPAAHYTLGGIATGLDGRSSLARLYSCGEAACSGLHGANRLASNSLLEGLVLGAATGRAAAGERSSQGTARIAHRAARNPNFAPPDRDDLRKALTSRLWRGCGILRDRVGLADCASAIESWRRFVGAAPHRGRASMELENLLLLGALVVAPAILREESRGTHTREDFPDADDVRFRGSFHWTPNDEPRFVSTENAPRG